MKKGEKRGGGGVRVEKQGEEKACGDRKGGSKDNGGRGGKRDE